MSAMLEAAGLWKPTEEQSFKADFPWQPVTLFYQRRSEDTVKHMCLNINIAEIHFESTEIYVRIIYNRIFSAYVNMGYVPEV